MSSTSASNDAIPKSNRVTASPWVNALVGSEEEGSLACAAECVISAAPSTRVAAMRAPGEVRDGQCVLSGRLLRPTLPRSSPKVAHLNQFGERLLFPRQGINREVKIQDCYRLGRATAFELDRSIQLDLLPAAACRRARPGMVREDSAHRPRYDREEVRPIRELDFRMSEQLQVRFIQEGGGLQSMVLAFSAKVRRGDPVQGGCAQ